LFHVALRRVWYLCSCAMFVYAAVYSLP
jgi:hypothetical protein